MTDQYFGYSTATNEQLTEARRMAARMGEDIRHYPPPTSGEYIEPTPDFRKKYGGGQTPGEETRAFYADGIEQIYDRIMSQDAVQIRQLAERWYQINQVLDDLRIRVRTAAVNLSDGGDGDGGTGGWTGAGAKAFLARGPGATLKSIDDWEQAALANWQGANALADTIVARQAEMENLYEQYKSSMTSWSSRFFETRTDDIKTIDDIPPGSTLADNYITHMREAQGAWHFQAQDIQYKMAREYWSVMSEKFTGGTATVYEGPSDAVMPNMEFIARYKTPNVPNIGRPNIQTPNNVKPNITKPNIETPNIGDKLELTEKPPQIAPPSTEQLTKPNIETPTATPPAITPPAITPPALPPVVIPPALPPALTGGQGGLNTLRPGLTNMPGANNLLNNLPGQGTGPGVLRSGLNSEGLPPQAPGSGRPGQSMPPPAIKGRGPQQGTPAAPPPGKRGPGENTTETPGTPVRPGMTDQFGGAPSTPASPVLRNPRATTPAPPSRFGGDRRRHVPGMPGSPGTPGGATPLRPDAAPPVLGRPQARQPDNAAPPRPTLPPAPPGSPVNPLAPPPRPTSSPVVGRSARLDPGAPQAPEPTAGVMRGKRNDGISGYEGEIGSRKREVAKDPQASVDEEFEKIRRVLDQEAAWKVDTPGGGVLDGAPVRSATPSAEPKPTLGS
ncbi:hypothetical protein [Micromonospora sp. CPCC 206061]|uniref:hypothetical protein n=1 Tax=Micromonospora sp. CPCC 206061 TaxID=3122410 RepID=UPI002FEF775B